MIHFLFPSAHSKQPARLEKAGACGRRKNQSMGSVWASEGEEEEEVWDGWSFPSLFAHHLWAREQVGAESEKNWVPKKERKRRWELSKDGRQDTAEREAGRSAGVSAAVAAAATAAAAVVVYINDDWGQSTSSVQNPFSCRADQIDPPGALDSQWSLTRCRFFFCPGSARSIAGIQKY